MATDNATGNISPRAAAHLFIDEVLVGNDLEALEDLVTESVTMHFLSADRKVVGRENLKATLDAVAEPFDDLEVHVEETITGEQQDRVLVRTVVTGTQTGAFVSPDGERFPDTGREFAMPSILVGRFEGGKIAEVWRMGAPMTMAQQLGWLPDSPGRLVRFVAERTKQRFSERRKPSA
jgi:ketosteroid isomerase-like protein